MKKPIIYLMGALALSSVTITSCQKDDQAPITENQIPNGFVKVSLSVQVVPSSTSSASTKRVSGLSLAKVTVSQANDKRTVEVDESGIAVFPNLFEGPVSIYVEADGYASVNTTSVLKYSGSMFAEGIGVDSQVPGFAQATVVLPRLSASLKGSIIGEFDFEDNNDPTLLAGEATVIARTSSMFQPSIYTTKVTNGAFTFEDLPEGIPLSIELDYSSQNTKETPNFTKDWELPEIVITLSSEQVKNLGNLEVQ